jgi:Protein of unknown function (DUF2971)
MTLYKYLTADRADILELGLIRYSQPIYLNDPFEMTPQFGELLTDRDIAKAFIGKAGKQAMNGLVDKFPPRYRRRVRILAWLLLILKGRQMWMHIRAVAGTFAIQFRQQFPQMIDRTVRRSVGVLSLSARRDNLLMWSHYADQHRGFVLALDEKHPVFNERRSDQDELNHLRKVVYSNDKMKRRLTEMSGVDLLLRKSPEWSHEEEWRIVRPLDAASAMAVTADHSIYLYSMPPEAIQGIIFGAHITEEARQRIQRALYADPAYDHVWQKQAEVASDKFALNFFRMPGKPSKFAAPDAKMHLFDLDPETMRDLQVLIEGMVSAGVHQPLDLSRLKDIHVSADIRATIASIPGCSMMVGDPDAQVLAGSGNAEADVYVFLRAGCFVPWDSASAEARQQMLHLLHRQMVRVHNITMRYRVFGEKLLTTNQPGANGYLAPVALNIWNDYVVARLSASTMPQDKVLTFIPETAKRKQECSSGVVTEIVAYQTHKDLGRLMVGVVRQLQAYLCAIAGAIGYADGGDPALQQAIIEGAKAAAGPDQSQMMDDLIATFRRMYRYYPVWEEFSMYDELMYAVRLLAFQCGISLRDVGRGRVYIAIL